MRTGALLLVVLVSMATMWRTTESTASTPEIPEYGDSRRWQAWAVHVEERMLVPAYQAYVAKGFPHDELAPLGCRGVDTWGAYALTMVDALDVLLLSGNTGLFEEAVVLLKRHVRFDRNLTVSVFESNIRVLGGLLSAYHTAETRHPSAVDRRPLLRLAVDVGERLLVAFDTPTGIPFGSVNLAYGVASDETPVTSLAGGGSYLVEFGALSAVTGDPRFYAAARRAALALWRFRTTDPPRDLVGSHINIQTGLWTEPTATIGSNADSFYEYLAKAAVMFDDPVLWDVFAQAYRAVSRHLERGPWHRRLDLQGRGVLTPVTAHHLEAFWPGLQVLAGDVRAARAKTGALHRLWRRHGGLPERTDLAAADVAPGAGSAAYHLRPELIESIYHVLGTCTSAACAQRWRMAAVDHVLALESRARAPCGYAALADVRRHPENPADNQLDRCESFVFAETFKYLWLIFDVQGRGWPNRGNTVFSTEGHVFPVDGGWQKWARAVRGDTHLPWTGTCRRAETPRSLMFARGIEQTLPPLTAGLRARLETVGSAPPPTIPAPRTVGSSNDVADAPDRPRHRPHTQDHAGTGADGGATWRASGTPLAATPAFPLDWSPDAWELWVRDTQTGRVWSWPMDQQAKLVFLPAKDVEDNDVYTLISINGQFIRPDRDFVFFVHPQASGTTGTHFVVVPELGMQFPCIPAAFGPSPGQHVAQTVVAVPRKGCGPWEGTPVAAGKVAIVERGDCFFTEKVLAAQEAGATAVVVINHAPPPSNDPDHTFIMAGDGTDRTRQVRIPSVMISAAAGERLLKGLQTTPAGHVTLRIESSLRLRTNEELAQLSPTGSDTVWMIWEGKWVVNVHALTSREVEDTGLLRVTPSPPSPPPPSPSPLPP